jgi:hypothetical protein
MNRPKGRGSTVIPAVLLSLLLVLLGLLLLALSGLMSDQGVAAYFRAFFKDLGIVILAVTTIHLLYHLILARSYQDEFMELLRHEVAVGESNAAVCAALGIVKIYPNSTAFEQDLPLSAWLPRLTAGSRLRVVGRSLFLLMCKAEILRSALRQGAQLELCLLHPETPAAEAAKITELEVFDIQAAVSLFAKKIADPVAAEKPPGSVELRYHRLVLFDTYLHLDSPTDPVVVWDLSFGPDASAKRIVVLDARKPFAADLTRRYAEIWAGSTSAYEYKQQTVSTNHLPNGISGSPDS